MTDEADAPDWLETLEDWVDKYPGRISLGIAFAAGFVLLVAHGVATENAEHAQHEKDGAEIRRHMTWLKSLPESEKRAWSVFAYCHPASAPNGLCDCKREYYSTDQSEAVWLERLANGDVVCHAQK